MKPVKTTWFLFGKQSEIPEDYSDPTYYGYYRFYYVKNGDCWFSDKEKKVLLQKGNVHLLPRKPFALAYGNEKVFEHIWGHFQIEGWQFNDVLKISLDDHPVFKDFVALICDFVDAHFKAPKPFENQTDMINLFSDDEYFDIMSNMLSSFVGYIYRTLFENEVYKKPLDGIIDYINSHLDQDLANDTLAEIAQYSKAHFIQEFSRIYNISPQKYVIKARMSQAITMLMNNEKIYNIAYRVGYDNPKSFARAFKRETGYTPQDYRAIHYLTIHETK